MNKKMSVAVVAMLVVPAGCAGLAGAPCQDKVVTVHNGPAKLRADPPHVEICDGQTLTIQLKPGAAPGTARTAPGPKEQGGGWLSGTNRTRDRIDLIVRETWQGKETKIERKYSIEIDGVGMLDPRVTVAKK